MITEPSFVTNSTTANSRKKDFVLGAVAGALIGLLLLPILHTAKPSLYVAVRFALIPAFTILTVLGLVVASWLAQRFAIVWQIAKFGVIGVMNTLVDIGVLAFISLIAVDSQTPILVIGTTTIAYYSLYKACSFIVANINSFFWNKFWAFHAEGDTQSGGQFFTFFAVSLVGFAINILVASAVFALAHSTSLNAGQWGLIAAAAGSITGLVWNFLGYKFFVFKK